ncbi:hypothetical protein [Thauera sinica]|uniref:Uncharacterized protein n=1 Tax=Thauera sinica TaxID=2665146 RepID=A0ABW1AL71_9RHOO|nr:hypothetical protein [Thauera sp. K11]ATE59099.1 hypothetical protein CCZ27_03235 [Thauera sp. K11]
MAHPALGAPAPTPCNNLRRLQAAITDMDGFAQGGLSEISAIAKLALAAMETPDGYRHPEMIAQALSAIWGKAESIENCINTTAEKVGCNYRDPDAERRYAAYRTAFEEVQS